MFDNKKILIVDDEITIIEIIKSYLKKEGFEVIEANNGKIALEEFFKQNPALIILDLMLPDINGEDVCKEIREFSKVPIIMISGKTDETNILNGFKIGADDYITKPFSPMQLVARVNALLRRTEYESYLFSNFYSFNNGDLTINTDKIEVRKNSNLINLTFTEYNLLITMIKYPYKVFNREELINIIYGPKYSLYDRVIDTHIKNLRHKIESDSKEPIYILTVHGVGYKFGGL